MDSTHAAWFFFVPNTGHVGMLGRLMGGLKDDHRPSAGCNHHTVGEADPLALILTKELVADSPVRCLVLAPVGMDLPSEFRRQSVSQASHRSPRVRANVPADRA